MNFGHYRNKPVNGTLSVLPQELGSFLFTEEVESIDPQRINSLQRIDINLDSFSLDFGENRYEIGASLDNTRFGNFLVAEKWEFPYWRKNGIVYVPSRKNPIGEYLVILVEKNSLRKVPTSIHTWPLPPYARENFSKGDETKGCIRLRQSDMKEFFENIEIGAVINIFRGV